MKLQYLEDIILIIIAFIYIYSPQIMGVSAINYIYLFGIVYVSINIKQYIKIINSRKKLFYLFILCSIVLVYSFILDLLYNNYAGISFFRSWLYLLIDAIIVGPITLIILKKRKLGLNYLIQLFIKIAVLQSIIAILMFLLPDFRQFIFLNILGFEPGIDKILEPQYYLIRGFGLGSGYLYSLALFQSIGILLIIDQIIKKKIFALKSIVYIALITFSIVLNARIGLVVFPIALICYYLSLESNLKQYFKYSTMLILLLAVSIIFYEPLRNYFYDFNDTFKWLITGFELAIGIGGISGDGIQDILIRDHWHFPEKLFSVFFGTGSYIFNNPNSIYKHSDIGYIIYIYYGGLLLLCFAFSYFIYMIKISKLTKFLKLSLLFLIVIVHFKGNILDSNVFARGLILLTVYSYIYEKYRFGKFLIIRTKE